MAAQTLFLSSINGCTATLHYDDALLIGSSIAVDNTSGSVPVTFFCTTSGLKQSITVQPGNSGSIVFPTARSVVVNLPKLTIVGLTSYGMGIGAGIGT